MSSASIGGIAGRIGDEPWGTTLAAIAQRKLTGQLQLRGDDARLYRIAFVDGVVVGASSPLAVDSIVRVALTSHLISSSQVAAVAKRVAASPQRDEIDCVVESVGLTVEHAIKLRRRAVLQRAARTFAVDRGDYRLELEITLPIVKGIEVDIRTILALGIRMNLSESRLLGDLRKLGARFRLDPAAELSAYDFGADLAPVVEELRDGASIAEIDARHREVEPRVVQSMVYALVAGGACQVSDAVPTPSTRAETTSMRKPATIEDISTRTRTTEWSPGRRPTEIPSRPSTPTISRTMTPPPVIARTMTPPPRVAGGTAAPRTITADIPGPRTITPRRMQAQGSRPPSELPTLSRTFTPTPPQPPTRGTGSTPPQNQTQTRAHSRSKPPPILADEAFQRGIMALRRDDVVEAVVELIRATELSPMDVDYAAMLAWAKFCAAPDKNAIALDTRKTLERAIRKSDKPMMARFYLGRVERILGRVREALVHFKQVLDLEPGHADAAAEVRMLEPRMAGRR